MDKIEGVVVTPLKIIEAPTGDIYHVLKNHDKSFSTFGEAYFSSVGEQEIKGWKKHKKMTLNIVVPVGEIRFVLYDNRPESLTSGRFLSLNISKSNYCRLTVPPGIWMGFQGIGKEINLLLNIASIPHDPEEADNLPIINNVFEYDWS